MCTVCGMAQREAHSDGVQFKSCYDTGKELFVNIDFLYIRGPSTC